MSLYRQIHLLLTLLPALSLSAQKQSPQEYIDRYQDLAVLEMHRSGVPASITLAQGILESSSGNSRLARTANNHFGIKCKGGWTGETIYADDDAPNECFRAYPSVLESYRDHSDFLLNNWRYKPLFELHITDYKGWSRGLKRAGYATNPHYHSILINLIERYELDQYDHMPAPLQVDPIHRPTATVSHINDIPVIIAIDGQSVHWIATQHELRDHHIRKWNDLEKGDEIKTGDIVYLKPKRRKGSVEKHVVRQGESMHAISQMYGIKLKHLYKKNRMEPGTQPLAGETLNLRKKIDPERSIALARPGMIIEEEPILQEPTSKLMDPAPVSTEPEDPMPAEEVVEEIAEEAITIPLYHTLVKGDNLYRISEKYQILEADLMYFNPGLQPTAMSIGQRVYLNKEAAIEYYGAEAFQLAEEQAEQDQMEDEVAMAETDSIAEEITVDGPVYHKVISGDTLYSLCRKYGITSDQLRLWNNLEGDGIQLGQQLKVSE